MNDYLIIDGTRVELSESEKVALSFSYAEISDPSKRKLSQSRTITIPGTQNNIKFFQRAYSLTWQEFDGIISAVSFDSSKPHICTYYSDNSVIFQGYIQILSSKISKGVVNFEAVLFSNILGLLTQIGDKLVSELGWSEYNHTLNHTNIENSWDTSVILNGVATSNFTAGVPDGWGYMYGLVDYGYDNILNKYKDNEIYPFIYQKEVVEKTLSFLGYTLDSDFMSSERGKRLMLGYGGGDKFELTSSQIADLGVSSTGDGNSTVSNNLVQDPIFGNYNSSINFQSNIIDTSFITITEVSDTTGQMAGGVTTSAITGNFDLHIEFDLDWSLAQTATGGSVDYMRLRNWQLVFVKNGIGSVVQSSGTAVSTSGAISVDYTNNFFLNGGDDYYFRLDAFFEVNVIAPTTGGDFTLTYDYNNTIVQSQTCTNGVVQNGSTIYLPNYIPKIKAVDNLTSLIKHFNLYVSEPDLDGVVTIEPLEDYYYDATLQRSLTKKIDYTKDVEIEPLALTQPKTYKFSFAEDKDYYRSLYFEKWEQQYGDYTLDNQTFFSKGESAFKLSYTITPPVEIDGTDLIIPRVIAVDNGNIKPFKGVARIYYYQGLRTGAWTLEGTNAAADSPQIDYPQVGHLDDIDNPTFDICFGQPREVFYNATAYTAINCYSEYYSRFINELTNPDAKMLKAYFRVTNQDVKDDFLRYPYNIDGVLYRINVVKDYVSNMGTTYYELIKIIEVKKRRTGFIAVDYYNADIRTSLVTGFGDNIISVSGDFTPTKSYNLYEIDTSSGDVVVDLDPEGIDIGKTWNFKKMTEVNTITLQPTSGFTIDGEDNKIITKLNTNALVVWNGTNFLIL